MTFGSSYPFLWTTLLAGLAASLGSGIIGSFVVVRRIVLLSGGISHAILGGMGLALWLQRVHGIYWLTPFGGALVSALLAAAILAWNSSRSREREDTTIALLWSTGMALGIVCLSLTPGYNVEVMDLLLGNISWVSAQELRTLFTLDFLVMGLCALYYRRFQALCFDSRHALLRGVPVGTLYFLLLSLVAITVVLLIQVVGALLVITLLSIPPAIAGHYARRLSTMMIGATLLSLVCHTGGISLAYLANFPVGPSIALVAALLYLTCRLERRLSLFHQTKKAAQVRPNSSDSNPT